MKIKKITIINLVGINNKTIFFNKNTIIMGKNNSGKTRTLRILYSALSGKLSKDYKKEATAESKIKISYKDSTNTNLVAIYSGEKLELTSGDDISNHAVNPIFIESTNININELITNSIQSELSTSPEFLAFKSKAELIADTFFTTINSSTFNGNPFMLSNIAQDKMPKYKVETQNNDINIDLEGDGIKKVLSVKLLEQIDTNIIIIDEIENHLSVASITEMLSVVLDKQIIASSHRIEVNSGIDTVTSINNETIPNIGAYINNAIADDVIIVEGKNDIPILKKALEIIGEDKILVVGTSKKQAKLIAKKYGTKAFIDRDSDPLINDGVIFQTSPIQMENYIPQSFIDGDDELRGITMTQSLSIADMVSMCSIASIQALKEYIADTADIWLDASNPLIADIRAIL